MRPAAIVLAAFCILLPGCDRAPEAAASGTRSPGRFAGIGVFDAGRLWAEMATPSPKPDAAAARLGDDEHIIVVLDSHSGEIRQCGDHSGFCVSMNPWTEKNAPMPLPAKLMKHASDLAEEDAAKAREAAR